MHDELDKKNSSATIRKETPEDFLGSALVLSNSGIFLPFLFFALLLFDSNCRVLKEKPDCYHIRFIRHMNAIL